MERLNRIVSGLYATGAAVHTRYGPGIVAGIHVGNRGRAWVLIILDAPPDVALADGSTAPLGMVCEPAEYVYERET